MFFIKTIRGSPNAYNDSIKYRHSNLWFNIENENFVPTRTEADYRAARRGTVQHEIFFGDRASPFEDFAVLKIKVNCKADATIDKLRRIPYGLVVSLEVAEETDLPIYQEVRSKIATAIQINQMTVEI